MLVNGRRGVVVFVHTSLEKSVSSIDIMFEFEETLWLSLKLSAGDCLLSGDNLSKSILIRKQQLSTQHNSSHPMCT